MLLIMMEQITNEVVTFGKEIKTFSKGQQVSFATRGDLPSALKSIVKAKTRHNKNFPDKTLDYRLLMVNAIEDISDSLLGELELVLAENL